MDSRKYLARVRARTGRKTHGVPLFLDSDYSALTRVRVLLRDGLPTAGEAVAPGPFFGL
jgi:hypothetical protein